MWHEVNYMYTNDERKLVEKNTMPRVYDEELYGPVLLGSVYLKKLINLFNANDIFSVINFCFSMRQPKLIV